MTESSAKSRWPRHLLSVLALGLVAVNAAAFLHVGAMVRWAADDAPTNPPEELGRLDKLFVLARGVSLPRPTNELTPLAFGVEADTVAIPNGHAGSELEAWYLPGADERLVVAFFHGYGASRASLLPQALVTLELGASALLVDAYGSGGSSGSGTALGIHEAEDVLAALEYLRTRAPEARVVLYGQSMGAAAVLRAVALRGARPAGVAVDSCYTELLSTVRARFRRMGFSGSPFAELLVFWGSVRIGANGFAQRPVDFARSVTCPALVLYAEDDRNITREEARALFEGLAGWRRFAEYPGAGHGGIFRSDPERWRRDLAELLAEVRGS